MSRFQVIGVNDSKSFCECCGKKGLKKVVWIMDLETQEEKHFGTTCALSPIKGFESDKEIKKAIKKFDDERRYQDQLVFSKARKEYKQLGGEIIKTNDGWGYKNRELWLSCVAQVRDAE